MTSRKRTASCRAMSARIIAARGVVDVVNG